MRQKEHAITIESEKRGLGKVKRNSLFFYIAVIPGIIFLLLFSYMPMAGLYMVFERYTFQGGLFGSEFVGLKNFEFFFRNIDDAIRATRNTVAINFFAIFLGIALNVAVAIALNEIRSQKFRTATQSILLFPYFISWIAIGAIARAFLDGSNGLINQVLTAIGLDPINWYMEDEYWWGIMVFVRVLKQVGYGSLVYYAALLNFDQSLYEAAKLDGATRWQQIRMITIPLLRPTIVIMFLLNVGGIMAGDLSQIMGMTQLNPVLLETTDTIGTYVYRSAIMNGQFESASAITLYQSVVGFALVMITNFIVKKIDPEYSLF